MSRRNRRQRWIQYNSAMFYAKVTSILDSFYIYLLAFATLGTSGLFSRKFGTGIGTGLCLQRLGCNCVHIA